VCAGAAAFVFIFRLLLIEVDKSLVRLKSVIRHLIDIKGLLLKLFKRGQPRR